MSPSHEVQIRTRMFRTRHRPAFCLQLHHRCGAGVRHESSGNGFRCEPIVVLGHRGFRSDGGLIIVALHQYWHGSPSIIVSLVGWLLALRGLLLLAFPSTFMSMTNSVLAAGAL